MSLSILNRKSFIISRDMWIMLGYFALIIIGLFFMLNINSHRTSLTYFYKQALFSALAVGAMFAAYKLPDMEKIRDWRYIFLAITMVLLILVLIIGVEVNGARRSLRIGPISLQPSLIARIFLIFYFALVLDERKDRIEDSTIKGFFRHFLPLVITPIAIWTLILFEKHFSTLVISFFTLLGMLWAARIKTRTILLILALAIAGGVGILSYGSNFRKTRIKLFREYSLWGRVFGSENETRYNFEGKDYQVKESLTALSSGKLIGTGVDKGRGKQYFLPEAKTDYVFAIIGEEFGFLGALVVFGIYAIIFFRASFGSWKKESLYMQLFGLGLALNLFLNVMVNIGVAMAALPSTGVTLPFISYGGTSLVINSVAIGLILNITARRKEIW
ncbi:MAG: FtsW/RodA/SpoVE family cell cycle protein [Candidatus Cloacimonetes bacterium]|nr:FtsW/RodA/SpoVE family cell cycle protein [Candidatus Cloacimonadota bacterium]